MAALFFNFVVHMSSFSQNLSINVDEVFNFDAATLEDTPYLADEAYLSSDMSEATIDEIFRSSYGWWPQETSSLMLSPCLRGSPELTEMGCKPLTFSKPISPTSSQSIDPCHLLLAEHERPPIQPSAISSGALMSECTKFNAVDPDKAKAAETLEHPCARIPTPTAEVKLEEDIRLAPSSHNTEVTTSVKPSASRNHTLQRTQRPPHHIPIRHSTRLASKSGLLISSIGPDHGLDEENSCDDSFSPVRYLKSGRRQTKKVPQRVWCSSCGLNFTREADLRRHEETIHSSVSLDEIYSETRERYRIYCNRCRAILGRVDARQRHEKNKSCGRSRMIREAREKNGTISGHLQLKLKAHQSSRPHAASSR